jgi:hypothetical protein
MPVHRLARLLLALKKQTEEGKIARAPTSDEGVFQASFPKQSIQLYMRDNFRSGSDIVVRIRNANGQVVESFADTDLVPFMVDSFDVMTKLYERVRRQALGADKAIDDILKELEFGGDDDIPR